MKAITFEGFGGPEHLQLTEVPVPEPGEGEVRVRVRATGINPYDWHIYRGDPWIARLSVGVRRKGLLTVGADFAGEVDAVGPGVTSPRIGDAVYGQVAMGACAEQVIAPVQNVASMPIGASFPEAAAVPMGAFTALQGLRQGAMAEGMRVLVIGASGGVGHMAVQMARVLGASRVVAVCSSANKEMMLSLGADRVIAYDEERVEDAGEQFDLVYDTVVTTPLRRLVRIMTRGGRYVVAGALGGGAFLGPAWGIFKSIPAGWFLPIKVTVARAATSGDDLVDIAGWMEDGKVRSVIDTTYPLAEYRAAFEQLEAGHVAGKVVLEI